MKHEPLIDGYTLLAAATVAFCLGVMAGAWLVKV